MSLYWQVPLIDLAFRKDSSLARSSFSSPVLHCLKCTLDEDIKIIWTESEHCSKAGLSEFHSVISLKGNKKRLGYLRQQVDWSNITQNVCPVVVKWNLPVGDVTAKAYMLHRAVTLPIRRHNDSYTYRINGLTCHQLLVAQHYLSIETPCRNMKSGPFRQVNVNTAQRLQDSFNWPVKCLLKINCIRRDHFSHLLSAH